MYFYRVILAVILCFSFTQQSFANCYKAEEAEAEQGIRIHSELMVIGLNCSHLADANGNNLYLEHKKFTKKHETLFARYEKTMIEHMRKNGTKNPEKSMHLLRTKFANKISSDVAAMRPDIFCKSFASRIEQVSKMDEQTFRNWAATPFPEYPVSKPLCEEKSE